MNKPIKCYFAEWRCFQMEIEKYVVGVAGIWGFWKLWKFIKKLKIIGISRISQINKYQFVMSPAQICAVDEIHLNFSIFQSSILNIRYKNSDNWYIQHFMAAMKCCIQSAKNTFGNISTIRSSDCRNLNDFFVSRSGKMRFPHILLKSNFSI